MSIRFSPLVSVIDGVLSHDDVKQWLLKVHFCPVTPRAATTAAASGDGDDGLQLYAHRLFATRFETDHEKGTIQFEAFKA